MHPRDQVGVANWHYQFVFIVHDPRPVILVTLVLRPSDVYE